MTKLFKGPGNSIEATAGATLTPGLGVQVGTTFGVAGEAAVSGEKYTLHVEGVHEVVCLGTDVIAQGVSLYWDDANSRLTLTSATDLIYAGKAAAASGNGVLTVDIKLNHGKDVAET